MVLMKGKVKRERMSVRERWGERQEGQGEEERERESEREKKREMKREREREREGEEERKQDRERGKEKSGRMGASEMVQKKSPAKKSKVNIVVCFFLNQTHPNMLLFTSCFWSLPVLTGSSAVS